MEAAYLLLNGLRFPPRDHDLLELPEGFHFLSGISEGWEGGVRTEGTSADRTWLLLKDPCVPCCQNGGGEGQDTYLESLVVGGGGGVYSSKGMPYSVDHRPCTGTGRDGATCRGFAGRGR